MIGPSRWQGDKAPASPAGSAGPGDESMIDPTTGEILAPGSAPRDPVDERDTVPGERTLPSVNRERSMQSRVSTALALGVMGLLGGAFLFWYYGTQFAASREAAAAAQRLARERVSGDSQVPPLGRIEPPLAEPPLPASSAIAAPATPAAPLASPTPTPAAGPPTKTPAELRLERQLEQPVLRRANPSQTSAMALGSLPITAASGATGSALAGGREGGALAEHLRPTPTPAVTAHRLPPLRFLLPKGAFIDCTLETAIDSTFEGMTTCVGASDVYSADGQVVLLERGTKYVGEQRGAPQQGQGRVFVLWSEARTPEGVVVQLASPGTDELGRNGLPGFVDNHFWQRFGAAILISVVDGTMQALAASQQGGQASNGGAIVIGPQGRDVVSEILRGTVAIPPTVIKNQGERIQILVARDVDFRTVYALRAQPER